MVVCHLLKFSTSTEVESLPEIIVHLALSLFAILALCQECEIEYIWYLEAGFLPTELGSCRFL